MDGHANAAESGAGNNDGDDDDDGVCEDAVAVVSDIAAPARVNTAAVEINDENEAPLLCVSSPSSS